jgi:pimeloyl-ACP methyl ester carboxylesterase
MTRHAIYLHGFASSPRSSKATWFVRRAGEVGAVATAPDLNFPDFETLTISRMIAQVADLIASLPPGPVGLVGSSLGAVVALHAAAAHDRAATAHTHPVDRLAFLAPAFDLVASLEAQYGPAAIEEWRRTDALPVHHYAEGRTRRLRWSFFEDARKYDAFAVDPTVPTLIFHGARDEAVDPKMVERWTASRPTVTLRLLDEDHQMLGGLDTMWAGLRTFLFSTA